MVLAIYSATYTTNIETYTSTFQINMLIKNCMNHIKEEEKVDRQEIRRKLWRVPAHCHC